MTEESMTVAAPPHETGHSGSRAVSASAQLSNATETPWQDSLPDDLKPAAAKFGSITDVVKSYAALEKKLGGTLAVPGADASPEELNAFYKRLGRPDTPAGYDLTLPDGVPDHLSPGPDSDENRAGFLRAMHQAGATPAVVQAAYDWYYTTIGAAGADAARQAETRQAEAETALRREWGADYDRNIKAAQNSARKLGGEELLNRLEAAGLANDPVCLRAFAEAGRAFAEDTVLAGENAGAGDTRQRIDQLTKTHFGKPSYYSAPVQSELRGLFAEIYGVSGTDS